MAVHAFCFDILLDILGQPVLFIGSRNNIDAFYRLCFFRTDLNIDRSQPLCVGIDLFYPSDILS
jgi:hypothetical protein